MMHNTIAVSILHMYDLRNTSNLLSIAFLILDIID